VNPSTFTQNYTIRLRHACIAKNGQGTRPLDDTENS
jgi:hypothetical protein